MTAGSQKQLLYGELVEGKRQRGRPKLRYKDICKASLSKCQIDVNTWEDTANDRTAWRTAVREGITLLEDSMTNCQIEKRQRRKESTSHREQCGTSLVCKYCGRGCASNIGRISHERSCKRKLTLLQQ